MSPRAAWRLESLGFDPVYDYVAGKLDWLSAGMPVEGSSVRLARAGDVSRQDVPTCRLDERIGDVRGRVEAAGLDVCPVVNERGVLLGLLRRKELQAEEDRRVDSVMRPGPSTFRPHVGIGEMAELMRQHDIDSVPVTTSDGRLFGVLFRKDAERAAEREHAAHTEHEH
jgi:CBS domain-containing protein